MSYEEARNDAANLGGYMGGGVLSMAKLSVLFGVM